MSHDYLGHMGSSSVYKTFWNILASGWYVTVLLSELWDDRRAPASTVKFAFHKLPGPQRTQFP